ncbi:hypothetical protein K438DRAFT_1769050 [Mycena galopus ATCC 62051]|nr:hypothetical protein K438DRAFT_1769050 [Mycena galopus ATCC 62051]
MNLQALEHDEEDGGNPHPRCQHRGHGANRCRRGGRRCGGRSGWVLMAWLGECRTERHCLDSPELYVRLIGDSEGMLPPRPPKYFCKSNHRHSSLHCKKRAYRHIDGHVESAGITSDVLESGIPQAQKLPPEENSKKNRTPAASDQEGPRTQLWLEVMKGEKKPMRNEPDVVPVRITSGVENPKWTGECAGYRLGPPALPFRVGSAASVIGSSLLALTP